LNGSSRNYFYEGVEKMNFDVNRLAMLEAVKNVDKVAPSNSPVELLKGILIESNEDTGEVYLTATNHEVSIQQKVMATVTQSGEMLINSRILLGMMSKMDQEFISISADKPQVLKVTGGECKFHINCHSPQSYPKPVMPFPDECVFITGICSLAKRTVFAVSDDDTKPILQCVQVRLKNNALHAAASDSMRMMLVRDSAEQAEEKEFLLRGRALQMLASISNDSDVFEVGDIGKAIAFVRGDMIFTINKINEGSYMNTAALVENIKPEYAAVADIGKMKEALSIVSVAASAGMVRQPINIVFREGEIIVQCNSDVSNAHSVVPANVTKKTPGAGFYYDGLSLLKLFQILGGKVKLEIDAKGFLVVKTRNEAYFQSPVRKPIKKKDPEKQEKERAKGAKDVKETTETKGAA